MFSVNYKEADPDILPEGEYECVIERAGQTVSNIGAPLIHIALKIRDDIENPGSGKPIFYDLWMKKKPTEEEQEHYDGWSKKQIQTLSRAVRLPNDKTYKHLSDWCEDLPGRPVRVTVYHDKYNGYTKAKVKWVYETRFPLKKTESDFVPPSDDDDNEVPF